MSHRDHNRTFGTWRHTALAIVTATLLTFVASGVGPIAPAPASAAMLARALDAGAEQFGVNTGVMFNSEQYTRAQINAQLAALAATGARVVRSDALWEDIETQPPIGLYHRYNWTLDDQIVSSLAAHGLRWLPIIDYAAQWARAVPSQMHSPPSSVSDYADFAAAVASRYGPGGSFWLENPGVHQMPVETFEIWNEPDNSTFWRPSPNPAAYATLYSAARSAILSKEAGAHVIIGGLTQPAWFLQAMLAADPGVRSQIDGVAIHPYASTPNYVFAKVRAARLAMNADGLGSVPLYVTEIGWTTHGSGATAATAAQRPGYITTTISTLGHSDCGIAAVLLYAWTTTQRTPSYPEDWFGIASPGGGGTADTAAFTVALAAAAAPAPPALLCTTNLALVDRRALPVAQPHRPQRAHTKPRRRTARRAHRRCTRSSAKHRKCRAVKRRA